MDQDSKVVISGEPCVVWHGHHEADSPLEVLVTSFNERREEIYHNKPPEERERRMQLFKLADVSEFGFEMRVLTRNFAALQALWFKTSSPVINDAFDRLQRDFINLCLSPENMAIHAKQCGCGWTPENNNIFEYKDTPK